MSTLFAFIPIHFSSSILVLVKNDMSGQIGDITATCRLRFILCKERCMNDDLDDVMNRSVGHIHEMKGREFDPYELNGGFV